MQILFLYAEPMDYTLSTLKELSALDHKVDLVFWDNSRYKSKHLFDSQNISFHKKSLFKNHAELAEFIIKKKPDLIVTSGWMDKMYLRAISKKEIRSIKRVCCLDGQWHGKTRQYFLSILGKVGFLKLFFDFIWVSGTRQFEYAKRLGFKNHEISFNLYSANLKLFNDAFAKRSNMLQAKHLLYPRSFFYVGRFEAVKNLFSLIKAWKKLGTDTGNWKLYLIGDGALKSKLLTNSSENIIILDYMSQDQLRDFSVEAGCFILPSKYEPWGVVTHEFSSAGLPLICSNDCGSSSEFLINGYNGFSFDSNSIDSLSQAIAKIINSSDSQLKKMSINSKRLSERIDPEVSAANLLSFLM